MGRKSTIAGADDVAEASDCGRGSRIEFANVDVPGGCATELLATTEYPITGTYSQIGQSSPWLAIGVSNCPPSTTPQGGVRLIFGYCLQE